MVGYTDAMTPGEMHAKKCLFYSPVPLTFIKNDRRSLRKEVKDFDTGVLVECTAQIFVIDR